MVSAVLLRSFQSISDNVYFIILHLFCPYRLSLQADLFPALKFLALKFPALKFLALKFPALKFPASAFRRFPAEGSILFEKLLQSPTEMNIIEKVLYFFI